jgi:hypothetical protein
MGKFSDCSSGKCFGEVSPVVHHKLHEDLYVRSQQPMFVTFVRSTKMACKN